MINKLSIFFCRSSIFVYLLIVALFPQQVVAAPLLRCQIMQNGSTQILDFKPESDPYQVKAIDINGRFRFKAVVIGDARQIAYIKLYIYDHAKPKPMLLHEAKYIAPLALADTSPAALTGLNDVYALPFERNLQYGCAVLEVAP